MKKKESQSALFSPPGRWTENTFLFKDGLETAYAAGGHVQPSGDYKCDPLHKKQPYLPLE